MTEKIIAFLNEFDLDVRKSRDARFTDQKCTPDVLCIISDCILNLPNVESGNWFTTRDIWESGYFIKNVQAIFNKPMVLNPAASHEYDKFIQQPLRLLAYSGILKIKKRANRNYYKIYNQEILEYISIRDRNSFNFLTIYLEKVIKDSGFYRYFEEYYTKYKEGNLSNNHLIDLKLGFQKFLIGNTEINGTIEANRIFPKVINILAVKYGLPGIMKGALTNHEYYFSDLMYNRPNFRDRTKNKNITRQENLIPQSQDRLEQPYYLYLIQKATKLIKKLHIESEVRDNLSAGLATQVHHIFPKSEFPDIAHYLENLIKLTASQHYARAHKNNNTKDIDQTYQFICLLAKLNSISNSIIRGETYYRKESFIYCLNVGLKQNLLFNLEFPEIRAKIVELYNQT